MTLVTVNVTPNVTVNTTRGRDRIPEALSDRWLADTTLFGTAAEVREGVEAWREAGVSTPILVPSSAVGKMPQAFAELFTLFPG